MIGEDWEKELAARKVRHAKIIEKYKDEPDIEKCPGYWADMKEQSDMDNKYLRNTIAQLSAEVAVELAKINSKRGFWSRIFGGR